MLSINNVRDLNLLQLQYATDSIGMRRSYVNYDAHAGEMRVGNGGLIVGEFANAPRRNSIKSGKKTLRPDIEWYPSYETYQARVVRLSEYAHRRPKTLPNGFPAQVSSARAWTASDFADPERYLVQLSASDIEEIKSALDHFNGLDGHHGPDDVSVETFPLPKLGERLLAVSRNIHMGTCFNVIRGIDPTEFSPLDNVLIYLGITSYIADVRGCQDFDGRMIVHIKDIEKELPDSSGRPSPYTNRAQPFHTDMCDILSMYVLDTAASGGESLLASSATVYNEIAATRPDLIHVLADDQWIHDDFNKHEASWINRPLLYNFKEHGPSFCYSRRPLTGAPFSPHHPDVPAMTEEQAEAIDAVHFTAVKHQLVIKLQPGDIEVFNNMALFHARNGFTDESPGIGTSCDGGARLIVGNGSYMPRKSLLSGTRHLLRLWLRSSDKKLVWEMPEQLWHNSNEIYGESEARKIARWDVHRAPPINRVLDKHFRCS